MKTTDRKIARLEEQSYRNWYYFKASGDKAFLNTYKACNIEIRKLKGLM